jgi:hypothetical protein
MGLIEKSEETQNEEKIQEKKQLKSQIITEKTKTIDINSIPKKDDTKGLLQKVNLLKKHIFDKQNCEIIVIEKDLGYNGLATRRILQDRYNKEYLYEIQEPILTDVEKEIKKELAHLFKMLADINISNTTEEEKKKFLKETLDQIIIDNDIDLSGRKIIKKDENKNNEKKPLFSKKTKEELQKQKLLEKQKKIKKLEEKKKKIKLISYLS